MHICGSMMSLFSACPATPGRLGVGGMLYLAVITVTCLRSCGRWRGLLLKWKRYGVECCTLLGGREAGSSVSQTCQVVCMSVWLGAGCYGQRDLGEGTLGVLVELLPWYDFCWVLGLTVAGRNGSSLLQVSMPGFADSPAVCPSACRLCTHWNSLRAKQMIFTCSHITFWKSI